ncbi:hypothetical protein C0J52_27075 [Blattella germanica]|nr:hypothetical protein C0J52_27075 [Blattella germanica]
MSSLAINQYDRGWDLWFKNDSRRDVDEDKSKEKSNLIFLPKRLEMLLKMEVRTWRRAMEECNEKELLLSIFLPYAGYLEGFEATFRGLSNVFKEKQGGEYKETWNDPTRVEGLMGYKRD